MGSGWDPQPSPPGLTSPDCARHHPGSGPSGPCAFLAVASPDPDVFLGPHPFLRRRSPLWDPGCTTLPPPLLGCGHPRAVSQVLSTLKPHLPSPWLWGGPREVGASRISGRSKPKSCLCSALRCVRGIPCSLLHRQLWGWVCVGLSHSLCVSSLSQTSLPPPRDHLYLFGGGEPQTPDTGVTVSQ